MKQVFRKYSYIVLVYLLAALLAFSLFLHSCRDAFAADANAVAHVAGSALLTSVLYITISAFTGREEQLKGPALLSAAAMSLAYGAALEVMDANGRRLDGGDMGANALGIGAASCAIILLDF